MLSRRGQSLSRLTWPSFAGTGLLERMRSTTFALLGITAAMGLGLVAVLSQQGWPLLPAAPLPGLAGKQGRVHEAVKVASGSTAADPEPTPAVPAKRRAGDRRGASKAPGSRLAESHRLAAAPPPAEPATGDPAGEGAAGPEQVPAPVSGPVPAPPSEPATPSAAGPPPATPAAAAASPAPEPPAAIASANRGRGNAYGKYRSPAPKGSPHYEPQAAPPPAPAVVESGTDGAAAGLPEEAPAPGSQGQGHGHAYGHSGG